MSRYPDPFVVPNPDDDPEEFGYLIGAVFESMNLEDAVVAIHAMGRNRENAMFALRALIEDEIRGMREGRS